MSPATLLLAAISLVPAMTGPLGVTSAREAMIALCGGGAISIPLDDAPAPGEGNGPCCAKGCHSGHTRKRLAPPK